MITPIEKRKVLEEIMRSDERINPHKFNPNQPKGQGRENYSKTINKYYKLFLPKKEIINNFEM